MILPSVSMLLSMTLIVGIGPPHALSMEAWQSLISLVFPRQCPTHSTILPSTLSPASLGGVISISPHMWRARRSPLPFLRSLRRRHAGVVDSLWAAYTQVANDTHDHAQGKDT